MRRRKRRSRSKRNLNISPLYKYSDKAKKYNSTERRFEFKAPSDFCLSTNPIGVTEYFLSVMRFIAEKSNVGKRIFFDISEINHIGIDALMYLLAIVRNLKKGLRVKFSFSGNSPSDPRARKLMNESGFFKYVQVNGKIPLEVNRDNLQIITGGKISPKVSKKIADFVIGISGIRPRQCGFLYGMIIELMSNTMQHAYKNNLMDSQWYCFVEHDSGVFRFSFLDTGWGIPKTVRKKWYERVRFLGLVNEDDLVRSALNGEFRTQTKELNRGKGLPGIYENYKKSNLRDFEIVSSRALVRAVDGGLVSQFLDNPLIGTCISWQIDIATLKGEKNV